MQKHRWPAHGWLGLALVAVFWTLNWTLSGSPTKWGFFPLWLGYSLAVDAMVFRRKGTSMLTRSPAGYASLFVVSAPAWWLFEVLNRRTGNWEYVSTIPTGDLEYYLFASISFSTVMPAVFGTAELASTFGWIRRLPLGPRLGAGRGGVAILFALGWLMLALLLAWPRVFYPLLWLSVYFILDPLNVWLGNRSLLDFTRRGDWRPMIALSVGCLICGFFWEMWNIYADPKWIYHVPRPDWLDPLFFKVFEMPLPGYGGYVPFAWELFALYHLAVGLVGFRPGIGLVQVEPAEVDSGFESSSE